MKFVYQLHSHFWICLGLGLLNMLDAVFTHVLLMNGARELNPLMDTLYAYHPILFLLLKFIFSVLIIGVDSVLFIRMLEE
jgi:Domain of unknown function (DUF5658)